MRRHHVGAAPLDRDAENGWEVTGLLGGTSLDGVRMAGFRDGAGAGLDMQVLPQPALVAVLAVGEARMTVESAYGPRPLRSFIASLSPGPARIRGAGRNAGDVALAGGYADQSHLHRDVPALTGCTPGALAGRATSAG
ncbi:hypothetical protein [Streptomyces globisporus]|uniref:AraC family transcriptional regulator n=1 Tax=Streptomyces globisporus TaxID=1908 RepID=A0A423UVW9_STRGL|nr:hypothetical protein [Streptomyces globisporus]ROV66475.1 hypothetical protein D3105_21775 [Streptomyces globisporus]